MSAGVGEIRRGFERYFSDLRDVLRADLDVTLYGSGGARGPGEATPPLLRVLRALVRALPLRARLAPDEYRDYKLDCLAFAMGLGLELRRKRFDVVHCIDPPLVAVLQHLRRGLRTPGRLVFTEGCLMPPSRYPRVDHIHHVGHEAYAGAVAAGVPASHMTLLPCGLHARRFVPPGPREELRRKHGVAPSTFVVVVVSAIKRAHKRVDHVVEEMSRVPGDVLLWVDGREEEPGVTAMARERLGTRCRITHVASAEVNELYGVADVFVHAALAESFGLAVVEALCSGVRVLAHDSPHFEWLIGDQSCLVDMTRPGVLSRRLRALQAEHDGRGPEGAARAARARSRFDWDVLRPGYVAMYRRVAGVGANVGRHR